MGKIASQTQWEDLANKVKAKQDQLDVYTVQEFDNLIIGII